MNILLIEDEPKIADFVMEGFHALGWHSTHVLDGAAGLDALGRVRFDAIVLDWMLPTMDGMAFLARLRESDHACPVIMLTAKAELRDKLQGFQMGADDYLPKPFHLEELTARLNVLVQRRSGQATEYLRLNGLELNRVTRKATWHGYSSVLSQREFLLLEYLMQSPGQIFTRKKILLHVWDIDFDPQTNVVDVCVQRLRKKLTPPNAVSAPDLPLETIRGVGYRWTST
jgi:two-component system OmpR family response regulator